MLKQKLNVLAVSSAIVASSFLVGCSGQKAAESADLGKVLDSFVFSLDNFKSTTASAGESQDKKEASDAVMQEFTTFAQTNLNNPSFTSEPIGLELKSDGMFEGYSDSNANNTRDSGEKTSFTVEVDTENQRLIATDMAGESTGSRFSGAGFLAGMLLGNLLSRQKKSGKKPSFKNKNVKPRSAYNSARSKSLSGSHSSGK